jgi:hypothetical protein
MKFPLLPLVALASLLLWTPARAADGPTSVRWKRTVVDWRYRSEGVAVADVNKDGKPDILVGDVWFAAPDWKVHRIRPGKSDYAVGQENVYSNSFACWAEDLNGDGWPDLIVIGFPGKACHWYENPQGKDEYWKEHVICKSACNETPQYVELFKKGQRVLVMGYEGKQMVWIAPGADPTKPWDIHPISDPKEKAPGTLQFSHGLGVGDVNGDGRIDVICTGGWWEQPEQVSTQPWKFHRGDLGPDCADMYAIDVDGDGKADIVSTSAHQYGFWVHWQRPGKDDPTFVRQPLFLPPADVVKDPPGHKFFQEEQALYTAINKLRQGEQKKAPLVANPELCRLARAHAQRLAPRGTREDVDIPAKDSKVLILVSAIEKGNADSLAKSLLADAEKIHIRPSHEIGVGFGKTANGDVRYTLIIGDRGTFSLPSQTHALNYVDIDGDGIKDLVTGRRWWAHGPRGDAGPNDPAFLYWFQGKRDSKGILTFTPHEIDDDSGIGTQFAIADINGDGLPDVIISNKRGVYILQQVRGPVVDAVPPRRE